MLRALWSIALLSGVVFAAELSTGRAIDDRSCEITSEASAFRADDHDAFVRIVTGPVRDQVEIEWIDPEGHIAEHARFEDLPKHGRLCLASRLPIAGYPAGQKYGSWIVRVRVDGRIAGERRFRIEPSGTPPSSTMISSVSVRGDGRIELTGSGFQSGSVVHIARFTESTGWRYLEAELATEITATSLAIVTRVLDPGEYVAVIRDATGAASAPVRFVISTGRVYTVPLPAGERPLITQGPNGSFSHWNRSSAAFDIVPQGGRYVAAMRSGIAYTHDLGLGQTSRIRSFGNYITVDHGDGEYSHYAHLATGRFLVRNGERVEAGQPLAVVGNSGYTLGPGGGYHVHVHVTRSPAISAQSIPFRFGEDRPASPAASGAVGTPPTRTVYVGQWFSEVMMVPLRAALLNVHSKPARTDAAVDVYLISPTGVHYGPDPEQVQVRDPEPGPWRISIEGMRSGPGPIEFSLESRVETRKPREARRERRGYVMN